MSTKANDRVQIAEHQPAANTAATRTINGPARIYGAIASYDTAPAAAETLSFVISDPSQTFGVDIPAAAGVYEFAVIGGFVQIKKGATCIVTLSAAGVGVTGKVNVFFSQNVAEI